MSGALNVPTSEVRKITILFLFSREEKEYMHILDGNAYYKCREKVGKTL